MELCPRRPRCMNPAHEVFSVWVSLRPTSMCSLCSIPHIPLKVPAPAGKPATNGVRHVPLLVSLFSSCSDSSTLFWTQISTVVGSAPDILTTDFNPPRRRFPRWFPGTNGAHIVADHPVGRCGATDTGAAKAAAQQGHLGRRSIASKGDSIYFKLF